MSQVKRWGNGMGIKIPKELTDELNIEESSTIYMEVKDGKLIVEPKKDLSLEEMLELITDKNRHGEIDFGKPIGRELL